MGIVWGWKVELAIMCSCPRGSFQPFVYTHMATFNTEALSDILCKLPSPKTLYSHLVQSLEHICRITS